MTRPPDLHLTLHGPTAACHELHPQAEPFAGVMAALTRAQTIQRRVVVTSWITRSSCRSLLPLVDVLLAHGVYGWVLCWPRAARMSSHTPPMVARLGIAVPHALRAVEQARRRGIAVGLSGIPLCALGPFATLRVGAPTVAAEGEPCHQCAAAKVCSGITPEYRAVFGHEELRPTEPLTADPKARVELEDAARMLSGEGASS